MKKLFYSSLILGSAFALASCSADEPGIVKGDGNVSLTVQLPSELATRFADAKQINTLYYSICTTGDDATVLDFEELPWPEGQTATTVDLQLVPGQTYQVVFFACNDEAEGYEYLPKTTQLNVSYKDVMTNNDQYDAFYAVESNITTTSTDKTITLTRPFAQLNIGTNDLGKGVVTEYLKTGSYSSTLTVPGLATGVNFLGKNYTTSTSNVVFTLDPVNTKIEDTYPVDNYNYLEMNYLLVAPPSGDAEGATLVNASYAINAGGVEVNNLNLSNLPLRANYQTNVYGSLLTTKSTFEVQIQKAFAGETNSSLVATAPIKNAAGQYVVKGQEELNWMRNEVAAGNSFEGETFVLANDITFGAAVAPIGTYTTNPGGRRPFSGTFDGQGHKIYNLTVNDMSGDDATAGMFGYVVGGTVKSIYMYNSTFNSTHFAGAIVALAHQKAVIESNHVYKTTVTSTPFKTSTGVYDGGSNVGGILGYGDASIQVIGNGTSNCTLTGYNRIGGICGGLNFNTASGTVFRNNSISNNYIYQSFINAYLPDTDIKLTYVGYLEGFKGNSNSEEATNKIGGDLNFIAHIYPVTTGQELADVLNKAKSHDIFELQNNIDCTGVELSTFKDYRPRSFLTLNGNGYTISNFTQDVGTSPYGGIFSSSNGNIVRDVNIENANVTAGNYSGILFADVYDKNTLVENVTFRNCTITSSGKKAGIVCGFTAGEGGTFRNITIENCSVSASLGQAGSVAGYLGAGINLFENVAVSGCSVKAGMEEANFNDYGSGKFIGIFENKTASTSLILNNCSVTNTTLTALSGANQSEFDVVSNRLWGALRYDGGGSIIVNGVKQ